MAKVKAVFYFPLFDNDGRNLEDEIDELELRLYATFTAWTWNGVVKGAYRMEDGSPSIDEHASYCVVLDETRISELEELLLEVKAKTQQETLYLEIQRGVDIRFLR